MAASDNDDRAAILRVIENETAAYFNKDYEAWQRCWVHASYVRRWAWLTRGGMLQHIGWEQEASAMRVAMDEYPTPSSAARDLRRENLIVRVDRNMAWVMFDQFAGGTGDPFDVPGLQHEMRILEKHDGEWRIACCFELQPSLEFVSSPLVRVDERSAVLWTNAAADEQLKRPSGLTVSSGHLRALNRASDKRLQASIRWAAGLKEYFPRKVAQPVMGMRFGALPVVLGESDSGAVDVCWVMADSGTILVSFNDEQTTRQRLETAAVIYGIAPAQLRVAGLIIGGHDLVSAAGVLGVSVNTVRTHLQRMYDKIGVRSQPALVRALLSVGSPLG